MVFTQGAGASPRSAALRAMRPVASIMGWSVAVVQLVTAAMAMAPWVSSVSYTHLDVYKRQAHTWSSMQCTSQAEYLSSGVPDSGSVTCTVRSLHLPIHHW